MKLEYSLQARDFLNHQLYVASKSPRITRKRRQAKIRVPVIYLIIAFALLAIKQDIMAFTIAGLAVLWFFVYPFWDRKRYENHYKKFILETYKARFGRKIYLEFTENSIIASDSGSNSSVNLNEVTEIVELPEIFLIRLQTGESLVLPKTEFQNIQELKEKLLLIAQQLDIKYAEENNWKWK